MQNTAKIVFRALNKVSAAPVPFWKQIEANRHHLAQCLPKYFPMTEKNHI